MGGATAVGRSPCTDTESSPRLPQLDKSPQSNKDPVQLKINKSKLKKTLKLNSIYVTIKQIGNLLLKMINLLLTPSTEQCKNIG